jgi:hypothetical protein
MPRYQAARDTWLSHENRLVKEGEEFETTFPDGMKLGGNIVQLKAKKSEPKAVEETPLV